MIAPPLVPPPEIALKDMKPQSSKSSKLYATAQGVEQISRAIRATEWDDENIADAARISTHVNLVTQARERALREVTADQQIAFYRLLTFLGISSEEVTSDVADESASPSSRVA